MHSDMCNNMTLKEELKQIAEWPDRWLSHVMMYINQVQTQPFLLIDIMFTQYTMWLSKQYNITMPNVIDF
jgi:hypothetical protein